MFSFLAGTSTFFSMPVPSLFDVSEIGSFRIQPLRSVAATIEPLEKTTRKRCRTLLPCARACMGRADDLLTAVVNSYTTAYSSMCKMVDFFPQYKKFSLPVTGLLALSAAGHTGGLPVHDGASVGSGRAPWRMIWTFKVAKSAK